MRFALGLCVAMLPAAAQALEVNGLRPGGSEADVKRAMPSAHCKPLEWDSLAADRRCDDARITFAGVPARVTVYLKSGVIQGVDVRFGVDKRDQVLARLKSDWGAPLSEKSEAVGRREEPVFKARWVKGGEQAVLTATADRKRATLRVWTGDFDAEIYRVR